MSMFIGVVIGLMLLTGLATSMNNNGMYVVLQFIFMFILSVGIPVLHLLS